MSEPLLKIPNHHAATCGDPPIINGEESHFYIGYFENEHGEQWIFTRDRKSGIATLRGGDIGWNTAIDVTPGSINQITFNESEQDWLHACLRASNVTLLPNVLGGQTRAPLSIRANQHPPAKRLFSI